MDAAKSKRRKEALSHTRGGGGGEKKQPPQKNYAWCNKGKLQRRDGHGEEARRDGGKVVGV